MPHARMQHTLIMVHDPSSTSHFAIQEHIVKRSDASKWITSFKREGFEVIRVNHNYTEGA